jgi:hypothetical protein
MSPVGSETTKGLNMYRNDHDSFLKKEFAVLSNKEKKLSW